MFILITVAPWIHDRAENRHRPNSCSFGVCVCVWCRTVGGVTVVVECTHQTHLPGTLTFPSMCAPLREPDARAGDSNCRFFISNTLCRVQVCGRECVCTCVSVTAHHLCVCSISFYIYESNLFLPASERAARCLFTWLVRCAFFFSPSHFQC